MVDQQEYKHSRVRVSDESYWKAGLQADLRALRDDLKLKQSCQENELLPFVNEAIEYCESELTKSAFDLAIEEATMVDEDRYVSQEERKRAKIVEQAMREKKVELEENEANCFYYYQAVSGENIFLHPLNLQTI